MFFHFSIISNTSDDVSRPWPWSCDSIWKNVNLRLPSILTLFQDFFPRFNILTLISVMLCIDFVSFQKGRFLSQRISKYWKPCSLRKKNYDFTKGMHSYVFNIGLNHYWSKKAWFNEKPQFLSIKRNCDIYWKLPYQHVCSLHYQLLDKIKWSTWKPQRDGFSFAFALVFLFFFWFVFACTL